MTNLAQNLLDTAAHEGAHPALRMDDAHLDYREFRDAALRVAAAVQARGIEPGDRVGMVLPNVLAFPIVFYGALLAGAARRADEPAAEGTRGGVLPPRLGRPARRHRGTFGRAGLGGGRHRRDRGGDRGARPRPPQR
jgi:non-ribosomal peptide synthetase component F